MPKNSIAIVAGLVLLISVSTADAQLKLNEDRFQELMASIVPPESTKLINWLPDLLIAQKVALEQKKPIFIWSMDGHPLGCT